MVIRIADVLISTIPASSIAYQRTLPSSGSEDLVEDIAYSTPARDVCPYLISTMNL